MGQVLKRWVAVVALAFVAACGDNQAGARDAQSEDAAPPIDALPTDAAPSLAPCLDRPTDLPRPPTGALPCDLLPPGFAP